ncbi:hypothetical protein SFUMM280S_05607 [Streptomyces fumanus]
MATGYGTSGLGSSLSSGGDEGSSGPVGLGAVGVGSGGGVVGVGVALGPGSGGVGSPGRSESSGAGRRGARRGCWGAGPDGGARGGAVALDGDDGAGGRDGHPRAPVAGRLAQGVDVYLDRERFAGVEGSRGPAEESQGAVVDADQRTGERPVAVRVMNVVSSRFPAVTSSLPACLRPTPPMPRTSTETSGRPLRPRRPAGGGAARVLVAVQPLAVLVVGLAGAVRPAVLGLAGRGAPVGRPQGEHGGRHHGGDDGGGDGTRAQLVPAGGPVLGVHRETAPVEAGGGATRAGQLRQGHLQRHAGRLQDGQLGGRDAGAGPVAGDRAFGGAAAARAVVDVPDQLAAEGGAQHQVAVAGEPGGARTGAGLHDGEGRAGALDLAGGGGEQLPRGDRVQAEDGGDLVGGQVVAYGEFEGLALLRGGAGRLRPGEQGQFAAALQDLGGRALGGRGRGVGPVVGGGAVVGGGVARRVGALTLLLGLGQLAQAEPAGQGVQPGPQVGGVEAAVAAALGEREDVAQGGGRGVVVAQHGQAVGEQAVQVRLVACERPLRHRAGRGAVTRFPVRPVRAVGAGRAGRGLRTAAHSGDRRRPWVARTGAGRTFNPYG